MQRFFRIKNFEKFQHYTDRTPPWIKLYNQILDDYKFGQLADSAKGHLIMIWLLASRNDNRLPWDERWIATRIQATSKVSLNELLELGFIEEIQDASNEASASLADCKQSACLEERREEERRGEREGEKGRASTLPPCPTDFLVSLYHETCPSLGRMQKLTDARSAALKARWRDHSDLDFWRGFFRRVEDSDFLCGRVPPRNSEAPFKADFEWIIKQANFVKILEGRYDNRRAVSGIDAWFAKQETEGGGYGSE